MGTVLYSIPGVSIQQARSGCTYSANKLPSSISQSEVTWTRLGLDEQYNVTLYREDSRIEVIETTWNEDLQEWFDKDVTDTKGLNLVIYLP